MHLYYSSSVLTDFFFSVLFWSNYLKHNENTRKCDLAHNIEADQCKDAFNQAINIKNEAL